LLSGTAPAAGFRRTSAASDLPLTTTLDRNRDRLMKMIVAIIQPTKLRPVQEALQRIGVERMTVCDAQGFGRQKGHTETYRGIEYKTHLLRKIALEIAVNDDFLDRTLKAIVEVARTGPEGNIGDGKIFVLPMDEAIQVGGVERGPGAI
jgi:nitrogen regulatory protein PII